MKKFFLQVMSVAVVVAGGACSREKVVPGRPPGVIESQVRAEVFQKIQSDFPEYQNIKTRQSALFEGSATKHIVLLNESEVYVTFVSEGAGYENTFGWYSYHPNSKPTSSSQLQLNVLFPTVSDRVLKQGDMLKLSDQKFPAGTVIGFFLIIRGWSNGTVDYNRETFYTNIDFNTDGQQQHVLFKQKSLGEVVLAFEDQLTTRESDQDYNDIIFTVTDNRLNQQVSNIDLKGVVEL